MSFGNSISAEKFHQVSGPRRSAWALGRVASFLGANVMKIAQDVPDDVVTFGRRFGKLLLRSARLSPRCVGAFYFVAFVHLVRSARIIGDHARTH